MLGIRNRRQPVEVEYGKTYWRPAHRVRAGSSRIGTHPLRLRSQGERGQRNDLCGQPASDANYQAFLAEAPRLEAEYAGYLVAYADGSRVAIGRTSQELLENLPTQYRRRALFIKDLPDRTVKFHRPFLIHEN